MMMRYAWLSRYPVVFQSVTGLRVGEFDQLVADVLPLYTEAEQARLTRPDRQRALGAGHPFALALRDHVLLTVVWLRVYATHEVLGYLFGVSDSTVSRLIRRVLPVLEQAGRDTMRMPDPGRKQRRKLDELLQDTPELVVVIDTFEQRVQRPRDREEADKLYSGKKKQHTLKSQVAVDEVSGRVVDVGDSAPGPKADLTLLAKSKLMARLPEGVGGIGDSAYQGIAQLHPHGLGASPRKKPRGQPRPPEDKAYNTAFSSRRIIVENTIGRMRRYQSITQTDRNHRQLHTPRVVAIAGLVNRQIDHRMPV
ncbi:MAG: transposase [Propionibacteriaceae bacterium]|nr:transposase [Propionibacteriaceae bacterium]